MKLKNIEKILLGIVLYGLMIIVPLYVRDQYFDMLEAKAYIYGKIVPVLLLATIAELTIQIYQNRNDLKSWIKKKMSIMNIAILLFALFAIISSFLSISFELSWTGISGWSVGSFVIITLCFIAFTFSSVDSISQYALFPIFVIMGLIFIETIIEGARFDFLGFHKDMVNRTYYNYFSTLGNTNWYAGVLSLWLPMLIALYISGKKKEDEWVFGIILFLALSSMILINVESMYLSMGLCLFFMLPLAFKNRKIFNRFIDAGLLYDMALILIRNIDAFQRLSKHLSGINGFFLSPTFSLPLLILLVVLKILINKTTDDLFDKYKKKALYLIEGILFLIVIVFTIYVIMHFTKDFGSNRAEIWMFSFEKFKEYPLIYKIIGVGPEMLSGIYIKKSYEWNALLNSAHSEIIQVLMTMGFAGLLSYLTFWSYIFVTYIKNKMWNHPFEAAMYLSLIAYFGQSLVNSPMVTTACEFCCFVILFNLAKNSHDRVVEEELKIQNRKNKNRKR